MGGRAVLSTVGAFILHVIIQALACFKDFSLLCLFLPTYWMFIWVQEFPIRLSKIISMFCLSDGQK